MRWLAMCGMLLCGGCLMSADQLAGFSRPGVHVKKDSRGGWDFEAGSDMRGKAKVDAKPDGSYTFDMTLSSKASDVVEAEGQRADHLVELRKIEAQSIALQLKMVGDMASAIVAMVPGLAASKPQPPPGPSSRVGELTSSRDEILMLIREALGNPTPRPEPNP